MSKNIVKTGLFLVKKGSEILTERQFISITQTATF